MVTLRRFLDSFVDRIIQKKRGLFIGFIGFSISVCFVYLSVKYQDTFYLIISFLLFSTTFFLLLENEITNRRINLLHPFRTFFLIVRSIFRWPRAAKTRMFENESKRKLPIRLKVFLIGSFVVQVVILSVSIFLFMPSVPNEKYPFFVLIPLLFGKSSRELILKQQIFFWIIAGLWFVVVVHSATIIWNSKDNPWRKKLLSYLFAIVYFFSSLTVSTFISLLFVLAVAKFEVFTTINQLNAQEDLSTLQIYTNPEEIEKQLKNQKTFPKIISGDSESSESVIQAVFESKKNRSEFYKKNIVGTLVSRGVPNLELQNDTLYLPNHTLIVLRINKDIFNTITPNLTKKVVEQHFDPRYIKTEPDLEVISKQEYIVYRDEKIDEQVAEIDRYIEEINNGISAIYGYIANDKNKIAINKNGLEESIASRDSDYAYCMEQANKKYCYTYYGYTYCYPSSYTESYCNQQLDQWNSIIQGFQKNSQDWEAELRVDLQRLTEYKDALELLNSYREIAESQRDTVLFELGLFEPPSDVKVVLENVDPESLSEFFSTATHEYLHYTSYISDERILPRFFEEGLTEYFSRKSIANQLGDNLQLGYPVIVKVIEQMVKDIGEERLLTIYFDKDAKSLIATLDNRYGNGFYEDSKYYFSVIPFLSFEDSLKLANNILFRIGGSELRASDFR